MRKITQFTGQLVKLPVATGDGVFIAHYSDRGLAGLDFPVQGSNRDGRVMSGNVKVSAQVLRWHRLTSQALKAALAGRNVRELPPLDWTDRTDFQQAVWREMLKLAPGETISYGGIATALGKPKAFRAVGGACGANPLPVLVPCHRVLAANLKLGGFSGGLDWKRTLLGREGMECAGARLGH
jgi:O-6-methylguanine DNA methyltransferase